MFEGKQIRAKRRSLNLSAERLASLLGVNVNNLYKWEKGHRPHDPEDYMKVEKWLADNGETGTTFQNAAPRPQEAQHGDKSEILEFMREQINDLKKDKAKLEKDTDRLWNTLESSLIGLSIQGKQVLATVSVILEKDNERDAQGNKKKEQALKDDTDKRIGDKFSAPSQTDNSLNRQHT